MLFRSGENTNSICRINSNYNPFLEKTCCKSKDQIKYNDKVLEKIMEEKYGEKIVGSPDVALYRKKIKRVVSTVIDRHKEQSMIKNFNGAIEENKSIVLTARIVDGMIIDDLNKLGSSNNNKVNNVSDNESELNGNHIYDSPKNYKSCCNKMKNCQCLIF